MHICPETNEVFIWDGGIYELLFGYRYPRGPKRYSRIKAIAKLQDWVHEFVEWKIDKGWTFAAMKETDFAKRFELTKKRFLNKDGKWVEKGFAPWMRRTKFYDRYRKRKYEQYNKIVQTACMYWPDLTEDIVCYTDWWIHVVPGKYGNVSGKDVYLNALGKL